MLDILTKIKQKNRKDWFINVPPDALDLISKTHPFLREFYSKNEIVEAK